MPVSVVDSICRYKAGKAIIPDGKRIKEEKTEDGAVRLIVSDAKKEDAGTYKVEVSNDWGTDSSDAKLTVKGTFLTFSR